MAMLVSVILTLALASTHALAAPLVFAHFMVGLTFNWDSNAWSTQMRLAAQHNIDAFALNVGVDPWQADQLKLAYDAASGVTLPNGNAFKVFLSLDMSSLSISDNVTTLVSQYATHKSNVLVNSTQPLISTFAGQTNMSGLYSAVQAPLQALSPSVRPAFVPAWFSLDSTSATAALNAADGLMNWYSWPLDKSNVTNSLDSTLRQATTSAGKLFMASVSPLFFTHYTSKNYIYRSDNNLYATKWKQIIDMNPQPDFVQIVSWNDFGESHYIGPIAGDLPNGTTWVTGFDHQAWLNMSDHYITWVKTGTEPAITEDAVYFNYRPHAANAVASSDSLPAPTNASFTDDMIYTTAFISSNSTAAHIRVTTGGQDTTYDVKSGISSFSTPFSEGQVRVELLDGSQRTLASQTGSVEISNKISTYNFNYASEVMSAAGGANSAAGARWAVPSASLLGAVALALAASSL